MQVSKEKLVGGDPSPTCGGLELNFKTISDPRISSGFFTHKNILEKYNRGDSNI